ncbi:MAG: nucleotidyltransferase domain-containing protein [Clostridium sp.]|nr:nucleotidyltransferase domain-containing protein [Clostridium sp.]
MCTENTLKIILDEVCNRAKDEFGTALDAVILYGSYARGDYDEESDIDVMIIADMPSEKIRAFSKLFSDYSLDIDLKYDIVLSLVLQDKATYDRYKSTYPFFKNIEKEGVDLVA